MKSFQRATFGSFTASLLLALAACSASNGEDSSSTADAITLPAGNLVDNPSFESDLAGWHGVQGSLSRVERAAPNGRHVAKVTREGGSTYSIDQSSPMVGSIPAGASYSASAYVRAASASAVGKPIALVLRERTGTGEVVQLFRSAPAKLTDSFQQLHVYARTLTEGDELKLELLQDDAMSGDAFYVDAFAAQRGHAGMVFAWLFGYQGDRFVPETELGLSPAKVLDVASQLEAQVGKSRLALVTSVNFVNDITASQIPTIKRYVDQLHEHAANVFGRVNVLDDSADVASRIDLCLTRLGLDGVWFDHPESYYESAGPGVFGREMDRLVTKYPSAHYILNYTGATSGSHRLITPEKGATWPKKTFASPTTRFSTDDQINFDLIKQLGQFYDGKVILHLDANPDAAASQPMSVFADRDAKMEIANALGDLQTGLRPSSPDVGFHFLVPVVGSWTCSCSKYGGLLYNGLAVGTDARSTFSTILPEL